MANKKKPFYTKKTLLLFRLFALIAIVILIASFINSIIYKNLFSSYSNTIFYITNIISIFLLFFAAFFVQYFEHNLILRYTYITVVRRNAFYLAHSLLLQRVGFFL